MHSATENEFIGRNGSRRDAVNIMLKILGDVSENTKTAFIKVYGCFKIGKSWTIRKAISEINEQQSRKLKEFTCNLAHPFTTDTFKAAVEELINKGITFRKPIKRRFDNYEDEDEYKIDTIVKKANLVIDEESRQYEVVLIWYESTEIDYSNIDPFNLFLLPGKRSRRGAKRKVITEQQINTEVLWRNVKPVLCKQILITRFFNEFDDDEEDEVKEFISKNAHKAKEPKEEVKKSIPSDNSIERAVKKLCGQHPGLLSFVCEILRSIPIKSDQLKKNIEELLDPQEKTLPKKIELLKKSLSNKAVERIRNNRCHRELEYNGLLTKNESGQECLISLLEMFGKNRKTQKIKKKGGNMSIIEPIISATTGAFAKFLLEKLVEALYKAKKKKDTKNLQKMQEELKKFVDRESYTIEDKKELAEIYNTLNKIFERMELTMISEEDLERFKTFKKEKSFKIDEDLGGEIYQSNVKITGSINKDNHDVLLFYKSTANKRIVLAPGKANFDNNDNPTKWEFDVVGLDDKGIYTFRTIMVDSESSDKILGMFPYPEYSNTQIKTFNQLKQFLDKEGVCFELSNEVNFTRQ